MLQTGTTTKTRTRTRTVTNTENNNKYKNKNESSSYKVAIVSEESAAGSCSTCTEASTNNKRQEARSGESPRSRHFWLDETLQVTWVMCPWPRATAQRWTTSQKGRSMIRWSTWVFAFLIGRNASSHQQQKARSMTRWNTQVSASLTGRNASSHMSYMDLSNRNCAARNYVTKGKKHDPVKHLGLRRSDWTKRLKSDELYQGEASARASAPTETCIQ